MNALEAALSYAERDWRVIPIPPGKKYPAGITDWQHKATTDRAQIKQWWNDGKRGVGIATGAESGLFVLDVDGAAGRASLERLEAEHGSLPGTLTARTGGGGEHRYFRHTGVPIGTRGGKLAPGLDVRGEGGVVVAPPSVHESGQAYAWGDEAVPVAEPPSWLVELAASGPAPSTPTLARGSGAAPPTSGKATARERLYLADALREEVEKVRSAPEGTRNPTLNEAAFNLYQLVPHGLDEDLARDALAGAADSVGLEPGEIAATIDSGIEKGKLNPRGERLPEMREAEGDADREYVRLKAREEARERYRAEKASASFVLPPSALSLTDELAGDLPQLNWVIEDVQPEGTNALLTAQFKTGKTTLALNLLRSLADGEPFLGYFDVAALDGRVAWWNYELTQRQAVSWLGGLGIKKTD